MKKLKRVLAFIGALLLVGLYILTFVSALLSTPYSKGLFMACVFSTVFIPVMIYAILLIYRILKK